MNFFKFMLALMMICPLVANADVEIECELRISHKYDLAEFKRPRHPKYLPDDLAFSAALPDPQCAHFKFERIRKGRSASSTKVFATIDEATEHLNSLQNTECYAGEEPSKIDRLDHYNCRRIEDIAIELEN